MFNTHRKAKEAGTVPNYTDLSLKKETMGSKNTDTIPKAEMEKEGTSSDDNYLRSGRNTKDEIMKDNATCKLLGSENKVPIVEDIPTNEGDPVSGDQPEQTEPPDGGWGWVIVVGISIGLGINTGFNKSVSLFYQQVLMRFGRSAVVTAGLISTAGTLRMVLSMFLISTIFLLDDLLHIKCPQLEAYNNHSGIFIKKLNIFQSLRKCLRLKK